MCFGGCLVTLDGDGFFKVIKVKRKWRWRGCFGVSVEMKQIGGE